MRKAAVVGVMLLVVLLGVTVWPTRWRTDQGAVAGEQVTLRTDRLTGEVQRLTTAGWRPVRGTAPATATVASAPKPACTPEQLAKIDRANPFADIGLQCTPPAGFFTRP